MWENFKAACSEVMPSAMDSEYLDDFDSALRTFPKQRWLSRASVFLFLQAEIIRRCLSSFFECLVIIQEHSPTQ